MRPIGPANVTGWGREITVVVVWYRGVAGFDGSMSTDVCVLLYARRLRG